MSHAHTASVTIPSMDSVLAFESLCRQMEAYSATSVKQELVGGFLTRYKGSLELLFRLLLPKQSGRLYHLQDKQLIKLLSTILGVSAAALQKSVHETGCIATSALQVWKPNVQQMFEQVSGSTRPPMTLAELDQHLQDLSAVTTEDRQLALMQKFFRVARKEEVYVYLRIIKQDLRLGAGIKLLLYSLHPHAYKIYQQCANIAEVCRRVIAGETDAPDVSEGDDVSVGSRSVSPGVGVRGAGAGTSTMASITLNMPVAPMLAAPSKGVDSVLARCPNGAFSEVKYDGERIQIHKDGKKFRYFARSLKDMKDDKYEGLQEPLEKALAKVSTCILDGEILLVDRKTSQPLPFGTLGKHKKAAFTDANTALFIFDILYLEGRSLLSEPLEKRRQLLAESLIVQPLRVLLSEKRNVVGTPEQRKALLESHFQHAVKEGLEGLVVKDLQSVYEPNARHWVKMKKDYFAGMADTADLVVLGGYYGTGNKGGILSVFLMGVLDKTAPPHAAKRWKTVVKVGNGHDDATLAALNKKYKSMMVPCERKSPPAWLDVKTAHVPDMVMIDPLKSDVWEIAGAEFSQTKNHTANGISLRFPRVIKIRDDKGPNEATSLEELKKLFEVSKEHVTRRHDLPGRDDDDADDEEGEEPSGQSEAEDAPKPHHVAHPALHWAKEPSAAAGKKTADAEDGDYSPPHRKVTAEGRGTTHSSSIHDSPVAPSAAPVGLRKPAAGTGASSSGIEVVAAEICASVKDLADSAAAAKAGGHQLLAHLIAVGGRWSNRGTMGNITTVLGERSSKEHAAQYKELKLGNVLIAEGYKSAKSGKIVFVGSVVCQVMPATRGDAPTIDLSALATGIAKLASFAMRQGTSTHFAIPYPEDKAVSWSMIQDLFQKHFTKIGLKVTAYGRSPSGMVRAPTSLPTTLGGGGRSPTELKPLVAEGYTKLDGSGSTASPSSQRHPAPGAKPQSIPAEEEDEPEGVFKARQFVVDPSAASNARELKALSQKITWLGGSVLEKLPAHPTPAGTTLYYVTAEGKRPPDVHYKGSIVDVPSSWINDCFKAEQLLPLAPSAQEHSKPKPSAHVTSSLPPLRAEGSGSGVFDVLKGCRIVIQGFVDPFLSELISKVKMMGGELHEKWQAGFGSGTAQPSTHLVCGFWGPAAMKAEHCGGAVVSRRWIDDCFDRGVRQPLTDYIMSEGSESAPLVASLKKADRSATPPEAYLLPGDSSASGAHHQGQGTKGSPSAVRLRGPVLDDASTNDDSDDDDAESAPSVDSSGDEHDAEATARRAEHLAVFKLKEIAKDSYKGSKVLHGLRFFIEGYSPHVQAVLSSRLQALGASVVSKGAVWDFVVSDLITSLTESLRALADRAKIVTWRWVTDTFDQQKKLPVDPYLLDTVRKPSAAPSKKGVVRRQAAPSSSAPTSANQTPAKTLSSPKRTVVVTVSDDEDDVSPPKPVVHRRQPTTHLVSSSDDDALPSGRKGVARKRMRSSDEEGKGRHSSQHAHASPFAEEVRQQRKAVRPAISDSESTVTADSDSAPLPSKRQDRLSEHSKNKGTLQETAAKGKGKPKDPDETETDSEHEAVPSQVSKAEGKGNRKRSREEDSTAPQRLDDSHVGIALPPALFEKYSFLLMMEHEALRREVQRSILAYGGKLKRTLSTATDAHHRGTEGQDLPRRASSSTDPQVLIIVEAKNKHDEGAAHEALKSLPKLASDRTAVIVSHEWVIQCLSQEKLLPIGHFVVA